METWFAPDTITKIKLIRNSLHDQLEQSAKR